MQQALRGVHPTMRWTIKFGKWLATTRVRASKASRWHFQTQGDARADEVTVQTGRGEDAVYVMLQHMKNHVWRELWPAMPTDARQYWRLDAQCDVALRWRRRRNEEGGGARRQGGRACRCRRSGVCWRGGKRAAGGE